METKRTICTILPHSSGVRRSQETAPYTTVISPFLTHIRSPVATQWMWREELEEGLGETVDKVYTMRGSRDSERRRSRSWDIPRHPDWDPRVDELVPSRQTRTEMNRDEKPRLASLCLISP